MFDRKAQTLICWLLLIGNIVFLLIYDLYLLPTESIILTPKFIKKKLKAFNFCIAIDMIVIMYFNGSAYTLIDDIKSLNEEIAKNAKEKEAFFATISHEIRNPLQSLIGAVDLFQDKRNNENTFASLMDICKNCAETVLNLVNNILDISKIAANKMILSPGPSDLREIINKMFRILQTKASAKNVELILKDDSNLPPCIEIDSQRMSQIILNLVSNAIKFTAKGKVIVKLGWHTLNDTMNEEKVLNLCLGISSWKEEILLQETDNLVPVKYSSNYRKLITASKPYVPPINAMKINKSFNFGHKKENKGIVKIEIMDTGIGISKDSVKKLFQPYQQADASISKLKEFLIF